MGKRSISAALVAVISAGFIALASPSAFALSSVESCFFNSINNERTAVGHPKLTLMGDLTSNARTHSQDMANDGTIYHNSHLADQIGGNWTALGENVGMGPSCESIHDAFMNSPGHKANILDTDYNQGGVGVVIKDGTVYVTEVFAGRFSSAPAPVVHHTVTPRHTTTTVHTISSAPRAAARPRPAPALVASPRTVDLLVQLVGMDARQVDPATGAAMGV
jgi:hypothetical protein